MRTYLRKRDKRNEEKGSHEVINEKEEERGMNRSMNLQAPRQVVGKTREKEEKTRKAAARQMWKTEKRARRRTAFIKSLT